MKIAIFQMNIFWEDVVTNLKKIRNAAEQLIGTADILVCPEMFTTGYIMHPQNIPDKVYSDTLLELMDIAAKNQIMIAGSLAAKTSSGYTNDFVFINADGIGFKYSKMHLFSPAGESEVYVPGDSVKDFIFKNVSIRPLICYDLRFPYCSFNTSGYQLLIYTANWPTARIDHWTALLKARAIENQSYVIGVNRVGKDGNGYEYPGRSVVYDYNGDMMIDLGKTECLEVIQPDFEALVNYKESLPFLKDRKH
jgi:omega-amidase